MKTVEIKGIRVGEGLPKICVSLTGRTAEEVVRQAEAADRLPCELIEFRADHLGRGVFEKPAEVGSVMEAIREATAKPVILTVRTADEGGMANIDRRTYYTLMRDMAEAVAADVLDIEAFDGEQEGFNGEKIEFIAGFAHSCGRKVILSNHDFDGTPDLDTLVKRLLIMQELGADIPKIAVMPENEEDVLRLLEAARIMKENYSRVPFIAISMGEAGRISRVCGGSFGSAVTFASAPGFDKSAPGQFDAESLKSYICEYYGDIV